jgi:hypothetical protein
MNKLIKASNLGNLSAREETTEYAKEKINQFIGNKDYHLALLIAHIYIGIRLKTLLINWVNKNRNNQTEENWKKIALVFKDISFDASLRNCKNFKLLNDGEFEKLRELQGRRNDVAHDSRLWRITPSLEEVNDIKNICESVIKFLERTQ